MIVDQTFRDNLVASFDENELRDLCYIRGIDYESLVGTGKSGKARELVSYCYRRGTMHNLVESCRALRPSVLCQTRSHQTLPHQHWLYL